MPTSRKPPKASARKPTLLAGGNPQIAKADGDAPVRAYLAAIPGWKRDTARRLDALIARTVPGVRKTVKWNSPFYGVEGHGWFLSLHCYTKYIKVAFFQGTALRPMPPGASKQKDVRYLDIHEVDRVDEKQLSNWITQAAASPGWNGGSARSSGIPLQEVDMKKSNASPSASAVISQRIVDLGDWRGETLNRMRTLIQQADPDVVEEWKWVKPTNPGIPVWSHDGMICTGETYKDKVKLTFARGASLKDPKRLFNSSLDGGTRRAIDIFEGKDVDASAFKALVREAVAFNSAGKKKPAKKAKS
jgi:hypothetical protein